MHYLIHMRRVDKNVLNVKCVKGECHLRSHPLPLELEGQARLSPCDIAIGNLGVAESHRDKQSPTATAANCKKKDQMMYLMAL